MAPPRYRQLLTSAGSGNFMAEPRDGAEPATGCAPLVGLIRRPAEAPLSNNRPPHNPDSMLATSRVWNRITSADGLLPRDSRFIAWRFSVLFAQSRRQRPPESRDLRRKWVLNDTLIVRFWRNGLVSCYGR